MQTKKNDRNDQGKIRQMINRITRMIRIKIRKRINYNSVVFISFNGKYADSPKIISQTIHKINPKIEITWILNDVNNNKLPNYINKVKQGSKLADKKYAEARAIIDNVYCGHECYTNGKSITSVIHFKLESFLKNKKHQKYYTTWHGTPIKKIGSDSIRNKSYNFSCPNTTLLIDNKFTAKTLSRITKNQLKIELIGEPKNDILFDNNIDIEKLKNKIGIPKNKKAILFAPTFRSNSDESKNIERSGINQLEELNINEILNRLTKKLGGDWVLIARFHYHVEKQINWDKLNEKYDGRVINGNKCDDIMDYLKCCDALITDISSCVFDFSLTGKPSFLYFPDYKDYLNNERGLYFSKEELPWPMAQTPEEFYSIIDEYNTKALKKNTDEFLDKLGYTERKPVAEEVANYILEDIKK